MLLLHQQLFARLLFRGTAILMSATTVTVETVAVVDVATRRTSRLMMTVIMRTGAQGRVIQTDALDTRRRILAAG
jgi:hypothetical protein